MKATAPKKKNRGRPVPIPKWWLESLNRLTTKRVVEELAADLQRVAPREPAWGREAVGKFLKGKFATFELMMAFCALYESLLPPVFIAASHEEAYALALESRRFRDPATPEKAIRIAALDKVREHLEESVKDQTDRLDSIDEGTSSGRRARGVARSRSPS